MLYVCMYAINLIVPKVGGRLITLSYAERVYLIRPRHSGWQHYGRNE